MIRDDNYIRKVCVVRVMGPTQYISGLQRTQSRPLVHAELLHLIGNGSKVDRRWMNRLAVCHLGVTALTHKTGNTCGMYPRGTPTFRQDNHILRPHLSATGGATVAAPRSSPGKLNPPEEVTETKDLLYKKKQRKKVLDLVKQ